MDFFNYVRDNSENEEIEETSIIHSYLHFPHPESNSSVSDTFENDYPQEKIYRISSESSLNFSDEDEKKNENYQKHFYYKNLSERQICSYPLNLCIENIGILNEFRCPICLDIVNKPIICKKCGNLFCKKCYETYKLNTNTFYILCPVCHSSFGVTKIIPISIENILNNLKFKCLFEGCEDIILLKDYKKHIYNCKYGLYKCGGCDYNGNFFQIEEHIKNCIAEVKKCKFCGEEYIKSEKLKHYKECSSLYTQCKNCGYKIVNSIFSLHENNCIKKHYFCNVCKKKFKKRFFEEHNIKKCINLQLKKLAKKKKQYYNLINKYEKSVNNLKEEIIFLSKKMEK